MTRPVPRDVQLPGRDLIWGGYTREQYLDMDLRFIIAMHDAPEGRRFRSPDKVDE